MHEFRRAGVFGLVWLAVGVGCAYAVDGGVKQGKPIGSVKMASHDTSQTSDTKSIPLSSILTTGPLREILHSKDAFPKKNPDRDDVLTNGYLRQIVQDSKGGASFVSRSRFQSRCNELHLRFMAQQVQAYSRRVS